ncbi:MAG: hypothetical protein AAF423_13505 [Pseudomonadota bacterium]
MFILAACASGKAVKSSTTFSAAEFEITNVRVNVPDGTADRSELRSLMLLAADNLSKAYGESMPLWAPKYTMVVSVQSYRALPSTEAELRYRVAIRDPNSGNQFRAVPVALKNSSSRIPNDRLAEGLIQKSLPEAFYRLYGLSRTPGSVAGATSGDRLFASPTPEQRSAPAVYVAPEPLPELTGSGSTSESEPTIITCDVC